MKKSPPLLGFILLGLSVLQAQSLPGPTPRPTPPPNSKTARPTVVLPPEKAQPVRIARFDEPPVIDGRLDDEAWKHAAVLKDFYQVQPGDNIEPSKATEVLLGYDAKFLYVAFRAHDEKDKIRATIAKRDAIFDDDYVGFSLDTYNDKRKAYEMFFNPLGAQADAVFTEGGGEDFSVDIVMESKGLLTADGYTVEIVIPFNSLRYEADKDRLWGVHFYRRIKRFNNELDSWMPLSRDNSSTLNQEGHITGLDGISKGRTLEIIPTLALLETGKRVRSLSPEMLINNPALQDPGRFLNKPLKVEPGVTVRLGLTPTVTLDFTLNPDFAEVEADQAIVFANQRFPIFFQEKRPFFLEGIDVFQTPLMAIHTRAIISPDYAVKLTGKSGRNTFGILFASDNGPGDFSAEDRTNPNLLPEIANFIDKNAYIGVLRLKRNVGKESHLGLTATSYDFVGKHNRVAGLDGFFRLNPQTAVSFQVLATTSRRLFFDPDQGVNNYRTGNAFGYSYSYTKTGRHFSYNAGGEGRTRDYRADVGFTRRTNTNFESYFVGYNSEPNPKAKLLSWRAFNVGLTNFDWQGRMQSWVNEIQVRFNFRRQSFFSFGFNNGYERLFEEEFGAKRSLTRRGAFAGQNSERSTTKRSIFAFGGTTPTKKYSAFLLVSHSRGEFDFDFGAGPRFPRVSPAALIDPGAPLDPGSGNQLDINGSFTYQPTNALRTSLNYTKSRLVRYDNGRTAFDDNIYALRATYQFTRFTFMRARVDYSTLTRNVRAQLLLGWTPNPGTSVYLGYNDDLNRSGFNPFTGQLEPGFRRNGRTFFVKLSYLFRRAL